MHNNKMYSVSGDINDFVGKVASEFNKYSQGDMLKTYEEHWQDGFPAKAFEELKLLLWREFGCIPLSVKK